MRLCHVGLNIGMLAVASNLCGTEYRQSVDSLDGTEYWIRSLRSTEVSIESQVKAAQMLGVIGPSKPNCDTILDALLSTAEMGAPCVRIASLESIRSFNNIPDNFRMRISFLCRDDDLQIRMAALFTLALTSQQNDSRTILIARDLFEATDPDIARAAGVAIAIVSCNKSELVKTLSDITVNRYSRLAALNGIERCQVRSNDVIEILCRVVVSREDDVELRRAAIALVRTSFRNDDRMVDALKSIVRSQDPELLGNALIALYRMNVRMIPGELPILGLTSHHNEHVRRYSILLLGLLVDAPDEYVDRLGLFIEDTDPDMQLAAIEAIGKLGRITPKGLRSMKEVFATSLNRQVRQSIITNASYLGRDGISILRMARECNDPALAIRAADLYSRLLRHYPEESP